MATISETTVALRFFGDDLEPDEITRLLGGKPTDSARKGDPHASRPKTVRSGRWLRSTPTEKGENLELQLEKLLDGLSDDFAVWRSLTSRYTASIYVGFFMAEENEGYDFSPATLKLLADRNLPLQIEIYAPIDD